MRRGSRQTPQGRANPGRVAAVRALMAVDAGAHLEEILAEVAPPDDPDRALAWFVAYGVVRRRGRVDAALRPHLRRPLGGLDPAVRATLRAGAFEILFARTAPHAAVHQGVEVARRVGASRASGLVNAVLRKVRAPEGLTGAEAVDAPPWLYARWTRRHGVAATEAWFRDAVEPPPLFVVLADPADRRCFDGLAVTDTPVPGVVRIDGFSGRVEALPGFDDGKWWVADLAAMQVADLVPIGEGTRVLDACAAPGGKSFRLVSRGARVFATDRSERRLARLQASARRLGFDVPIRRHDWTTGPLPDGQTFDAVLVDAPCTAIGTLRRNPEVKWRRQLVDVLAMPRIQRTILDHAAAAVRPGGALVYAVCSPEPEEGEGVIASFLADHPTFHLDETVLTAPPRQGEDAFYGARLVRT